MRESNHKGGWYFVLSYVGFDGKLKKEEFCVFNGACTRQRMLGVEVFIIRQHNRHSNQVRVARRGRLPFPAGIEA